MKGLMWCLLAALLRGDNVLWMRSKMSCSRPQTRHKNCPLRLVQSLCVCLLGCALVQVILFKVMELDLSDLGSVKHFVASFTATHTNLHILVLNAGLHCHVLSKYALYQHFLVFI